MESWLEQIFCRNEFNDPCCVEFRPLQNVLEDPFLDNVDVHEDE